MMCVFVRLRARACVCVRVCVCVLFRARYYNPYYSFHSFILHVDLVCVLFQHVLTMFMLFSLEVNVHECNLVVNYSCTLLHFVFNILFM